MSRSFFRLSLTFSLLTASWFPALAQTGAVPGRVRPAPVALPPVAPLSAPPSVAPLSVASLPVASLPVATAASSVSAADQKAVADIVQQLERAANARDAKALRFFDITQLPAGYSNLTLRANVLNLGVSPSGALVRLSYELTGSSPGTTPTVLDDGKQEFWLARQPQGGFTLSQKRWTPGSDALEQLTDATRVEWTATTTSSQNTGNSVVPEGALLHLVAERRGGRWIGLRRSRWDGAIFSPPRLARWEQDNPDSLNVKEWLRGQMGRFEDGRTGTAHFFLQRGDRGWVGLDTVWKSEDNPGAPVGTNNQERALVAQRQQMEGPGYGLATAHRDFGLALANVGVYAEAADELEKADALQPGLVGAARLRQAAEDRARDPRLVALQQLDSEMKVGLASDHPSSMINALVRAPRAGGTPLDALRIGLEYSKLGDDRLASSWLTYAEQLINKVGLGNTSPADAAWINVLHEHLRERKRVAAYKPPNRIHSALFNVRCWPDELRTLPVLAALEAAQHTIYADFKIPMGSTEIVLWRTQNEFQSYTSQFSAQGNSEFVAALTLTKLIATQDGPLVLGEEVNVFSDPRIANNTFSTVAHEYGHVAVRQLSRGRTVPVWFNEGIASSVEGGYDGYIPRVRRAAAIDRLLTMDDMLEWNVDGERAFLAYSQANSIVDFIVAHWGRQAILEILRQIGRDVRPDDAFRSVLGVSEQQLWERWSEEGIR